MQQPPNVPHGTGLEVWHGFAITTIVATFTAIRLWLNRNKPASEVHETDARAERTRAEARRIEVDASKSLGEVFAAMSAQLAEAHRDISEQRSEAARRSEEAARRSEFLQSEIERITLKEEVARARSHKAIGEVQRCVMTIRDYEEMMRQKKIEFTPFDFKSYEDIME